MSYLRNKLFLPGLTAFFIAFSFAGFLGVELHWTSGATFSLLPPRAWMLGFVVSICLSIWLWKGRRIFLTPFLLWVSVSFIGLYFVTDLHERHGAYFLDASYLGLSLCLGLFLSVCISRNGTVRRESLFVLSLVLIAGIVFIGFLKYAHGRLLFSDDHPSFLYRIQLLLQHFPSVPFYNPEWNAGYRAAEFPVVGVFGYYLLTWPIFRFFGDIFTVEGAGIYTTALAIVFQLFLPLSTYAAARLLRLSCGAAFLSGVFALGPSMAFFRWLLHYGTVGFALSAALFPTTFALTYRMFEDEEAPHWSFVFLLLPAALLTVSWPMGGVALVPLVVLALLKPRVMFQKRRMAKVVAFVLLFTLSEGPVLYMMIKTSNATKVLAPKERKDMLAEKDNDAVELNKAQLEVANARSRLRLETLRINPLLVVFFPFSIAFLPKRLRVSVICSALYLLLLALFGDVFKPRLEFIRFFVFLSFLMSLIAPVGIVKVIEYCRDEMVNRRRRVCVLPVLGILVGAIILSPLQCLAAYTNRTEDRFVFAPEDLPTLVKYLRDVPEGGRIFFTGFILHDLGASSYDTQDGGHIAPLSTFSGRELYAMHFYHVYWQGVDPIPKAYLERDEAGVEEFFDLVNVTSVVTFNKVWRRYCEKSSRYELLGEVGRFRVYRRKSESNYFLSGAGEIQIDESGFSVKPQTDEVVVKFRYSPNLRVLPESLEIFPVAVFEEQNLVGNKEQVSFVGLRKKNATQGMNSWVGVSERN